ncbi:MAG: tryptophan-rich sensory protein [Eubacteriales bacterium]|nr:tryptophan-rich sensory protein [Eubacteriales bacterium]
MNVAVKGTGQKISILIAYVAMVTVNALASILPINGVGTGEVSAKYDTLFTPAAYAFSIWGAIYLLLLVYVLFQFLPRRGETTPEQQEVLEKVGAWFVISSLFNIGWIFMWHYGHLTISVGVMALLLVSLMRIGWLLRNPHCNPKEELALRIPFGLYFGWITVATIANISVWLVSRHWDGFGIAPEVWTAVILLVGLLIAGITMYRIRSVAYGLAVTWAYAAILYRQLSASGYTGKYPLIIWVAGASVVALIVLLVITAIHMRRAASCTVPD